MKPENPSRKKLMCLALLWLAFAFVGVFALNEILMWFFGLLG